MFIDDLFTLIPLQVQGGAVARVVPDRSLIHGA